MKIVWGRSIDFNLRLNSRGRYKPPGWKKLEVTQRITNGADCYPWRPVFALWPVKTISGKYVWFRKVYKQRFWAVWGTGFHMEPCVEYAELFDILEDGKIEE